MSNNEETNYYKEAYLREKKARKEAEKVLEVKALELYDANEKLIFLNNNLEEELSQRLHQKKLVEKEFSSFVKKATDIIYRLDMQGNFTYVNPMARKISGFKSQELLNRNFTTLIHPDHVDDAIKFYKHQIQNNIASTYYEYLITTKYGDEIWLGQNVQLVYKSNVVTGVIAIARNITNRKKLEKSLVQSEEKYRGVLENLDFGLLEVGIDGLIIKAYPSFTDLTGHAQEDLLGKNPFDFLHPDFHDLMRKQEKKRKNHKSDVYEVQLRKKNGDYLWVIISGAPFYDIEGNHIGSIGIHLDISERKKMEEDLKKANQFAMASSKAKELFLANMSHEIRTPLNAVIGLTNLLNKTQLDAIQKKYTTNINKSANNLLLLVNDILDITKIENEKIEKNETLFTVKDFIENIHASANYLAEEKKIDLTIFTDNNLLDYYISDELRLTQILINLTNNAIKFTENGYVNIHMQLVKKKNTEHIIQFSVADSGKGISKEKINLIFNDFTQEDATISNQYGGTGLGLSISKKLVNLLGGNLKVKSKPNQGSKFYFSIPFKIPLTDDIPQFSVNTNIEKEMDWTSISILIAEDNPVNQLVIESTLNSWGVQTTMANNGAEAVELLKNKKFDLILMDMQMPIMDGITATKKIRKKLKLDIPIIAFTANAMQQDIHKCENAGMNDYISKPFKEEELQVKILNLLKTKPKQITSHLLSTEKLEPLSRGNQDFVTKMLQIFVDTSEEQLEILKTSNDSDVISKIAHKIKPSIDYISTEEMQNLVRSVEHKEFITAPKILENFIYLLENLIGECKTALQN